MASPFVGLELKKLGFWITLHNLINARAVVIPLSPAASKRRTHLSRPTTKQYANSGLASLPFSLGLPASLKTRSPLVRFLSRLDQINKNTELCSVVLFTAPRSGLELNFQGVSDGF